MRKYTAPQIIGLILSFFLPPVAVWFTEGFGIDFWINVILTLLAYIPGCIHATYIWIVWVERKWQTHHGESVTDHPFLVFSPEFEQRSRWKGNGQDGFFGYFDDNIKGGEGPNVVGGDVDLEKARPIAPVDYHAATTPVATTAQHTPATTTTASNSAQQPVTGTAAV